MQQDHMMRVACLLAFAVFFSAAASAQAQQAEELRCDDFRRNPDGTWTPTRPLMVRNRNGSMLVTPAMSFQPDETVMGFNVGAILDNNCR